MNLGDLMTDRPGDTIEGVVVAVDDLPEFASREEAALRAHRIRTHLQHAADAYREIAEATRRCDWQALGYESWDAWKEGEFGEAKLRLPADARRGIVEILRSAGMSTRAIGSALGVDAKTVRSDLRSTGENSPVPDRVIGRDGKERPATMPPRDSAPTSPRREDPVAGSGNTAGAAIPPSTPTPPAPAVPDPTPDATWSDAERELLKRLRDGDTIVVTLRGAHDNLIRWADSAGLYVRVDRKTPWGNPFELDADGDRLTVIANYASHYLPYKPSLLSKLNTLRGKALGCWCAPEACHADILAARTEQ